MKCRFCTTITKVNNDCCLSVVYHQCHGQGSNPSHLCDRPTLYHIAIKAGLCYCMMCQSLLHIPPPFFDSSSNLNLSNHSISGHQGARCKRWIILITNATSGYWTQHYHVAKKAGLNRKAVHVYYIPITITVELGHFYVQSKAGPKSLHAKHAYR